jgi:agmatinase
MMKSDHGDHAFTARSLYGTQVEHTYAGALSFLRRKYTRDLQGVDVAVTGIPFDLATTNRPGTRFGPAGVRAASAHLAWGPPWPWGFDPTERLAIIDYGDCAFDFGRPEGIPEEIQAHAKRIIDAGVSMLSLGGDHFLTLPLLRAHAERHGPLALIHFDAHSDTWSDDDGRIDHGTMFYHAVQEGIIVPDRSVQIGIRTHNSDPLGITWLDAAWVHRNGVDAVIAEIRRIVGDHAAYLTFDIDCLDPSYAPGTGTPVVGGLSTFQAQSIIRGLVEIDLVAMDVVEVAPAYDHADMTSLAAASLALDYLCLRAHKLPVVATSK